MYYKMIENGCITNIGRGSGGIQISEEEYNTILNVISDKPQMHDGIDFRLKDNLTWEQFEFEPEPPDPDPEIDDSDALNILLGGAV